MAKEIEIWADSFHEGKWCCDNIANNFANAGFTVEKGYINGFIPTYKIRNTILDLDLIVYGSYKSWTPLPKQISDLLEWGKPDFIAYDPIENNIIFAVEETAATPTGNQATQRCERQYGSARAKIPYWYLVSEYGSHIDGGIRRDSIWPTIAAIKLTMYKKTPCVVLHYSDIDNVEDYNSGDGIGHLFDSLFKMLLNYSVGNNVFHQMDNIMEVQYKSMLDFLLSQWNAVIDFLPSIDIIQNQDTPKILTQYALGKSQIHDNSIKSSLLVWPKISGLPDNIRSNQRGKSLLKFDALSFELENDITLGKAYVLSNNAGSGKPPKYEKIQEWVAEQKAIFNKAPVLSPPAIFNLSADDFPPTEGGNRHITTSKNVVYLYDRWSDLKASILKAYPRLSEKINIYPDEKPVFLYLSNSVKPGRLFGDPYTGQLSAFSTAFGKFDDSPRLVVAYFPHQVFSQAIKNGKVVINKGTTLFSELTDLILFNGGVGVSLSRKEII